jgi:hypothetical protein
MKIQKFIPEYFENQQRGNMLSKNLLLSFCLLIVTLMFHTGVSAQEKPPKPIALSVHNKQQLNFGGFVITTGGYVIVYANGVRSGSGVVLLDLPAKFNVTPAMFDVDGNPGTVVHISVNQCTGTISNGTNTLNMVFENAIPGNDFILVSPPMTVTIGVKLTVPYGTTTGTYGGSYNVTFTQE